MSSNMSDGKVFDVLTSSDLGLDLSDKEDDLWSCMSSPKDLCFTHDSILSLANKDSDDEDTKEDCGPIGQISSDGSVDDDMMMDIERACAEKKEVDVSREDENIRLFLLHDELNDLDIQTEDIDEVRSRLQFLSTLIPTDLLDDQRSVTTIIRGASCYIRRLKRCLPVHDTENFTSFPTIYSKHENSTLSIMPPCSIPIQFDWSTSTMTSCYHGHFNGGTTIQFSPFQATHSFTSIKEKKSQEHSIPIYNFNTFNPFLTNSLMQYHGSYQFYPMEHTTSDYRQDMISAHASTHVLTEDIGAQFRNDYPALSSVLDDDADDTLPDDDKQIKEQESESETVSSSRKNSDSTDTDIDLSFNADDDNVFLDCANPDDVKGNTILSADEPDSTTERKALRRNRDRKRRGDSGSLRRPKNGFIRFSVEYRKRLAQQRPNVDNREVSKMLGAKWRRMSQEEKEPYETEFRNDIEDLKKKHPEWRYAPMKRLSHDQLEPMPSRLRPRDKLKRKFPVSIAKGIQLPRLSPPKTKSATKKKRGKPKRDRNNKTLLGFRWMQCCVCLKWRYVPFFSNTPRKESNSFWFCQLNPDLSCNSCFVKEDWRVLVRHLASGSDVTQTLSTSSCSLLNGKKFW